MLNKLRITLRPAVEGRRVWMAGGIVGGWALLNLTLTAILVFGTDVRDTFSGSSPAVLDQIFVTLRTFAPAAALLFPFVWWISVSALMLLTVPLFGGRTDYASMLSVVGVSCVPWVLGYAVQLPAGALQLFAANGGWLSSVLGWVTFVVSAASLVTHVVLVVYSARIGAGTSYRGATASCALTGLGCATAVLVLFISVLTLVFLLSGAV